MLPAPCPPAPSTAPCSLYCSLLSLLFPAPCSPGALYCSLPSLLLPAPPAPHTAVGKCMTRLTCITDTSCFLISLTLLGKDPNVPLLPAPSTAPWFPSSPHCGGKEYDTTNMYYPYTIR